MTGIALEPGFHLYAKMPLATGDKAIAAKTVAAATIGTVGVVIQPPIPIHPGGKQANIWTFKEFTNVARF